MHCAGYHCTSRNTTSLPSSLCCILTTGLGFDWVRELLFRASFLGLVVWGVSPVVGCVSQAASCAARCGFFAAHHWARCCLLNTIAQAPWFPQLLFFQATSTHSGLVGVQVLLVLARVVPATTGKCFVLPSRASLAGYIRGLSPGVSPRMFRGPFRVSLWVSLRVPQWAPPAYLSPLPQGEPWCVEGFPCTRCS